MPVLNLADAIYAGTGVVSAIYYGSTEVYNIGGGPDPDPDPDPTLPVLRGNWSASGARDTPSSTSNSLPSGTQIGDTAFALVNTNNNAGPPTGGPVTWDTTPIDGHTNAPELRLFKGTVSSLSGNVTKPANGASLCVLMGVYAGDVDVSTSAVSNSGPPGTSSMTISGITAPANSLAVAAFLAVFLGSIESETTVTTSGWADRGSVPGVVSAGTTSTRYTAAISDRPFETSGATGSVTASMEDNLVAGPGYVGMVFSLVNT